jgi:hypothetical protein
MNQMTRRSLHVLVEEGDDSFRMTSEVIVTVLEATCGALDPEQFLVLTSQRINLPACRSRVPLRDLPSFQGNAIIRREIDVPPPGDAMVIGRLMEHVSERLDDGGQGLDFRVIIFGNGLLLFQSLFHSLV